MLRIVNKHLLKSSKEVLPEVGHVVVGFQSFKPIFAALLDVNGTPEWFELTFTDLAVQFRQIEGDECDVSNWAEIPFVIEVGF